jgi:hypothetical protein
MTTEGLRIERSNGQGKGGSSVYYIRPAQTCSNRSRKVRGFVHLEIKAKTKKLIYKWFAPMVIYYEVNGVVIGSTSKENALKEYWRICDRNDVGKIFQVKQTPDSKK